MLLLWVDYVFVNPERPNLAPQRTLSKLAPRAREDLIGCCQSNANPVMVSASAWDGLERILPVRTRLP